MTIVHHGTGAPEGLDGAPVPFEDLVRRYEGVVRHALRRVLGRHRDEDDLVQEVFLRLSIRLGQPGDLSVPAWLRRVARNVAIDELRRRRPEPLADEVLAAAAPPAGVGDDAAAVVEGAALGRILERAIAGLPDRQRRALLARLGEADALAALGPRGPAAAEPPSPGSAVPTLSLEARDSLVARARRQLRRELADTWPLSALPGLGWLPRLLGRRRRATGAARAHPPRPWAAARRLGRAFASGSTSLSTKAAVLGLAAGVAAGGTVAGITAFGSAGSAPLGRVVPPGAPAPSASGSASATAAGGTPGAGRTLGTGGDIVPGSPTAPSTASGGTAAVPSVGGVVAAVGAALPGALPGVVGATVAHTTAIAGPAAAALGGGPVALPGRSLATATSAGTPAAAGATSGPSAHGPLGPLGALGQGASATAVDPTSAGAG